MGIGSGPALAGARGQYRAPHGQRQASRAFALGQGSLPETFVGKVVYSNLLSPGRPAETAPRANRSPQHRMATRSYTDEQKAEALRLQGYSCRAFGWFMPIGRRCGPATCAENIAASSKDRRAFRVCPPQKQVRYKPKSYGPQHGSWQCGMANHRRIAVWQRHPFIRCTGTLTA